MAHADQPGYGRDARRPASRPASPRRDDRSPRSATARRRRSVAGPGAGPISCRRSFTTNGPGASLPSRRRPGALRSRRHRARRGSRTPSPPKGWSPTRVDAYRTPHAPLASRSGRDALRTGEVDAVTFTSASTVRGFVGALGAVSGSPKVVCIGPVTADGGPSPRLHRARRREAAHDRRPRRTPSSRVLAR